MARKPQGRNIDDIPTNNGNNRIKPSDKVDLFSFRDNAKKFVRMRLFGGVMSYGVHWVKSKTKAGKEVNFSTPCAAYDVSTGNRDSTKKCAWCDHMANEGEGVRFSEEFFMNAIIRSVQKNQPSKLPKHTKSEDESGYKEKNSDSWTPVRAVRLSTSMARAIQELKQLNTVEDEEGNTVAKSLADRKYGRDIQVKYDGDAVPANQYTVQLGEKNTPLRKEEREYLIYDLSGLQTEVTEAEAKKDYENWAKRSGVSTKKKGQVDDDDDDDDDLDDTPKSKGKSSKKSSKKSKPDEDDFDDEDDDEDDDEEDEKPKSRKTKSSKSKRRVEEDDDEDGEEEDDDDEDGDFDDEDDDDEDEDEDEPVRKKGKKPSKSSPKKAKKSRYDDDDDDDDDDEEEEEEEEDEDESPPRKSKRAKGKPKAKAKSKSKSRDDDDDDDDDFDDV